MKTPENGSENVRSLTYGNLKRLLWRRRWETAALLLVALVAVFFPAANIRTRHDALLRAAKVAAPQIPPASPSLVDEVGHLRHIVSQGEVARWKAQLHTGKLTSEQAARLHLWLGEYELSTNEAPKAARAEFAQVERSLPRSNELHGLAAYDTAMAIFAEGAYAEAAEAFRSLLQPKTASRGYDWRKCVLWYRHAAACAGYHADRQRIGIPEPTKLDPLCGAAAIATWLRARGLPYDKKTVLSACRVTGEGSNAADIMAAGKKFKLGTFAVSADNKGLIALPKPATAYVEKDHFLSVISANKHGVTYLCSDCGCWPGGRVHLTWKQWSKMDAGLFIVFTRPGTDSERWMTAVMSKKRTNISSSRVTKRATKSWTLADLGVNVPAPGKMQQHIVLFTGYQSAYCGLKQSALPCPPNVCCWRDRRGKGKKSSSVSVTRSEALLAFGPSDGDPVNLATGEEEYTPGTDLNVYNPVGPSIAWGRIYNSLRAPDPSYESDDFGVGWSTPYNVSVIDGNYHKNRALMIGTTTTTTPDSNDPPASGLTWDIVLNNTTIASSASPNGWNVTHDNNLYYNLTVAVPASASVVNNYEVRYNLSSNFNLSLFFDVVPFVNRPQIAEGESGTFPSTGTESPAANLLWDILNSNGATVATSSSPNGWTVNYSAPNFTLSAPPLASVGTYKVRNYMPYYASNAASAFFDVYAPRYYMLAGTKYVCFPNGSRFSFTAPAFPSQAQPRVNCTMPPGTPFLVEWDWDANSPAGYYTITMMDRSQWVTTNAFIANGSSLTYLLGQMRNRNGAAINFNYGASGTWNFPLLSSITDSNGVPLMTLSRQSGNLTGVSDRYGRSVYYHVGSYANSVPYGYTSFQELDHVSQVVPTGTANPANRYTYGYQGVNNGDSNEQTNFLHTITVPSPTGTGSSTSTINYTSGIGTVYEESHIPGLVASLVDANGNTRSYSAVGANGNPVMAGTPPYAYPIDTTSYTKVMVADSQGNVDYSYVAGFDNNMSQTTEMDGAGNIAETPTYGDPNDPYQPSSIVDAYNHQANYSYDQYGNLLTSTSVRGVTTTNTYDYTNFPLGELTQVQEGSKTPTNLTYYEPSGLPHTISSAKPGHAGDGVQVTTSYVWDGLGNIVSIAAPGNNATATITTTFNYTTDGAYSQNAAIMQPLAVTDNLGHTTHMRWDAQGRKVAAIDALGNETDTTFNIIGQPYQTLLPATGQTGTGHGGTQNNYLYPGGPLLQTVVYDEGGNSVRQVTTNYGLEGETLSETGSTEPVAYTYDSQYRMKTLTDGNNHTTHYSFNAAGYLASMQYPGGDTVQYPSYDALGNLLQRIDGRGIVTNYVFNDVENKLTDVQYPASPSLNVHTAYDNYGRITSISDGTGLRTTAYDDDDQALTETTAYTGLPLQTLGYAYYADGSTQTILTAVGAFTLNYDAGGRMTQVVNPFTEITNCTYLDNNWLASQQLANGVSTSYTRNALSQILTQTSVKAGVTLCQFSGIGYDGAGNRTTLNASRPDANNYAGTVSYQFDNRNQLLQEANTASQGFVNNFGYDTSGNATTFRNTLHSYNSNNQNTAQTFDLNGNPTAYGGVNCAFDAENRMTAYGSSMTAGYNSDGLRAWKQTTNGRTYFIYDGQDPLLELDATGNVTAVNTFGPEGLASRRAGGPSTFYTFDTQGNVVQRWNGGTLASSDLNDAFGNSVSTAPRTDPFGYGGKWGYYSDLETGLLLLGHRYYDPASGRFLNRDPMDYGGGINLYNCVGNNPVMSQDASGYHPDIMCNNRQRKEMIRKQLIDVCNRRIHFLPSFALRKCLRLRCTNINIVCRDQTTYPCEPGDFGDTLIDLPPGVKAGFTDTIYICPKSFNASENSCLGKTILHEMIHSCGDIDCQNQDDGPGDIPAGPGSTEGMTQIAYGPGTPPCPK